MTDVTPRFALPYLFPGQAEKEVFHNEAIAAIDSLLHLCIEAANQATPPATPFPGQAWIVAGGATGSWIGKEGAVAIWTDGGWRFLPARAGMRAWNLMTSRWTVYAEGHWHDGTIHASGVEIDGVQVVGPRQPSIPSPSGGTTIDTEARVAIDALIVTLMSHGLIE